MLQPSEQSAAVAAALKLSPLSKVGSRLSHHTCGGGGEVASVAVPFLALLWTDGLLHARCRGGPLVCDRTHGSWVQLSLTARFSAGRIVDANLGALVARVAGPLRLRQCRLDCGHRGRSAVRHAPLSVMAVREPR